MSIQIWGIYASKKGTNLLSSEKWSDQWPGFIEKSDGRLRKPRIWVDPNGIERCANSYFTLEHCCVCGTPTLKDVNNAKKVKKPVAVVNANQS